MSETRRCSACGAELTEPTSLQGLCPACLLRLGLSDPAMSAVREPVVSVPETATVEAVHTASPPAPRLGSRRELFLCIATR
jgi:NMD protein affecting ribosome stability and mRNA decay